MTSKNLKAKNWIKGRCRKCDKPRTRDGHDPYIANLPGVQNACCGHGREQGYIMFDNGMIIRMTVSEVTLKDPSHKPLPWIRTDMPARKRKNQPVKKRRLGEIINVQFLLMPDGHYWLEMPEGMAHESLGRDMLRTLWDAGAVHGPFDSLTAAESDSERTLLGEDCEVADGGQFPRIARSIN